MSRNRVYLITGANRGIGRGLVERYLSCSSTTVIAAVRNVDHPTTKSLAALSKADSSELIVLKIDSNSETDAEHATRRLVTEFGISHLDVVIGNAGICKAYTSVACSTTAAMNEHFAINALGPLILFQAVHQLLRKSKNGKFVAISSLAASVGKMEIVPVYHVVYGVSKGALNHITRRVHFEHPALTVFSIDPGWVRTELGIEAAMEFGYGEPPTSIQNCIDRLETIIEEATREKTSGHFIDLEGNEVPW